MVQKFLKKTVEVANEDECNAPNSKFWIEYYLVESDYSFIDDNIGAKTVYGIEIVKKVNEVAIEKNLIKNISTRKDYVFELLNKIARNIVTPISLPYILEDIVGVQ